jgi:hypothetical protein
MYCSASSLQIIDRTDDLEEFMLDRQLIDATFGDDLACSLVFTVLAGNVCVCDRSRLAGKS